MFYDLLTSCMLIFIVVHTCTDLPNEFASIETASLLDRMIYILVRSPFEVQQMFSDLLRSRMLIFIAMHTCTDPQIEFVNKVAYC